MHAARRGRQSGFTLVEVMVTVILIAILASLAAPSFQSTVARFRVRTAAESLMSGLQLARSEALRRNQPVRFTLGARAGNWSVITVTSATVVQEATGGTHASLSVTPNAGQTSVVFLANGLTDTSAARLEQVDVTTSVAGVSGWRVEVFGGGQVRMCDPAATAAADPRKC